jgi:hypothetical protein
MTKPENVCTNCGHARRDHGPKGCKPCRRNKQRSRPCKTFQEPSKA